MKVDDQRYARYGDANLTGIFIRADVGGGKYDAVDIMLLDRASLIEFAGSRGEVSTWAMALILHLLGWPMREDDDE